MEIMPRAHLVDCQGNNGSMSDTVESHLLSVHRDVLDTGLQHTALGIQSASRIVCRQLEHLQLLRQSYNKKEAIRGGSGK